ncbi:hypothetical protein C8R43DRAFT_1119663 [Mycena crocata]|nr:hypothetical protein C8R43DRAFT_1119663 [Mycena crocata]
MFNKVTLLFLTFVASSVLAAPVPNNAVFQQCLEAGKLSVFDCSQEAAAPPSCNKELITSQLADLTKNANEIKNVGLVLPDPLAADKNGATLTTVFTQLDAANAANAAGDFATVASSLQTLVDVTDDFLGPLLADGLESGADLQLNQVADDTASIAKLCAAA